MSYLIPISFSLRQMINFGSIYQSVTLTNIRRNQAVLLPDQLHIIYVNSSVQDDTTFSADLCMTCVCPNSQDMYSKILARRVKELKETQEGVDTMCDKLNELISGRRKK